jgi:hypothetical protein
MRKTHLWISLLVGVAVWGVYFGHVIQSLRRGDTGDLALWFLGALAVILLIEAVAGVLIGWLFRKRSRTLGDGPTLTAALKASHIALMILIGLALVGAASLSVTALIGWTPDLSSARLQVAAANGLLALVVIAELSRAAFTLALLPRR